MGRRRPRTTKTGRGALKREEAAGRLRNAPLFTGLADAELERILSECSESRWRKGETIENDEGTEWFNIVVEGRVKLVQTDLHTGRRIALFLLGPGDVFDVLSLLDGQPHLCEAIALDDVTLMRVRMEKAREWLRKYPDFNARFLPYIGGLMRHLERFAEEVVFHETAERLARLILRHTVKEPDEEGRYPVRMINDLPHEVLAELIGTVRSVVTSQLQRLKREEMLLRTKGRLAVKNLEELARKYAL